MGVRKKRLSDRTVIQDPLNMNPSGGRKLYLVRGQVQLTVMAISDGNGGRKRSVLKSDKTSSGPRVSESVVLLLHRVEFDVRYF